MGAGKPNVKILLFWIVFLRFNSIYPKKELNGTFLASFRFFSFIVKANIYKVRVDICSSRVRFWSEFLSTQNKMLIFFQVSTTLNAYTSPIKAQLRMHRSLHTKPHNVYLHAPISTVNILTLIWSSSSGDPREHSQGSNW